MTAFLMTWKEDGWPHENILRMIEMLREKGAVEESWRISAHRQSRRGARVWLLRQGKGEKGIFGVGEIVGEPNESSIFNGERRTMVPVLFSQLTDPRKEFLIGETAVRQVLSENQVATQSSGITITDQQSARFEEPLPANHSISVGLDPSEADKEGFDPDNIIDARERILRNIRYRRGQRAFRDALLEAYERRCAITACPVLDILEAAHIYPYVGPQTNHVTNGLLLRCDLHTLFDCGLIGISPQDLTVITAPELHGTTYQKLHGRRLRRPVKSSFFPNKIALEKQLRANRLWNHADSGMS